MGPFKMNVIPAGAQRRAGIPFLSQFHRPYRCWRRIFILRRSIDGESLGHSFTHIDNRVSESERRAQDISVLSYRKLKKTVLM
jgi:hypothetical protein